MGGGGPALIGVTSPPPLFFCILRELNAALISVLGVSGCWVGLGWSVLLALISAHNTYLMECLLCSLWVNPTVSIVVA